MKVRLYLGNRCVAFRTGRRAFLAVVVGLVAALAFACGGEGDVLRSSPTAEVAALTPTETAMSTATASPTATPTATPTTAPMVDARSVPVESLLRPGAVLDEVLYPNMDGSTTGQIVILSHSDVPADADCGEDRIQQYLDIFAADPGSSSWTKVFDATTAHDPALGESRDWPMVRPPAATVCPLTDEIRSVHLIDFRGNDRQQVVFDLYRAFIDARQPEVVVIEAQDGAYGVKPFLIDFAQGGSVDWGDEAATPPVVRLSGDSHASFESGLPACHACPNGLVVATIGYNQTSGQVEILGSAVDLHCEEGLVGWVDLEVPYVRLDCGTAFLADNSTSFSGATSLADLHIGQRIAVGVGSLGNPPQEVNPLAARIDVLDPASSRPSPPGAPVNFRLGLSGSFLRWEPGTGDPTEYHVERRPATSDTWTEIAVIPPGTPCCEYMMWPPGQEPEGTFMFRIYGENSAGRSPNTGEVAKEFSPH